MSTLGDKLLAILKDCRKKKCCKSKKKVTEQKNGRSVDQKSITVDTSKLKPIEITSPTLRFSTPLYSTQGSLQTTTESRESTLLSQRNSILLSAREPVSQLKHEKMLDSPTPQTIISKTHSSPTFSTSDESLAPIISYQREKSDKKLALKLDIKRKERSALEILIAEDDGGYQKTFKRKMENRLGVTNITFVNSGTEAIEICKHKKFDVIFMDIVMVESDKNMNGIVAAKEIRKLEGVQDTPIIFQSTSDDLIMDALNAITQPKSKILKPYRSGNINEVLVELKLINSVPLLPKTIMTPSSSPVEKERSPRKRSPKQG